jgi:hypothetical protein
MVIRPSSTNLCDDRYSLVVMVLSRRWSRNYPGFPGCHDREEDPGVERPNSSRSAPVLRFVGCNVFAWAGLANPCPAAEAPRHWRSIRGRSSHSSARNRTSRWMRLCRRFISGESSSGSPWFTCRFQTFPCRLMISPAAPRGSCLNDFSHTPKHVMEHATMRGASRPDITVLTDTTIRRTVAPVSCIQVWARCKLAVLTAGVLGEGT